jgi:hypothetical protein
MLSVVDWCELPFAGFGYRVAAGFTTVSTTAQYANCIGGLAMESGTPEMLVQHVTECDDMWQGCALRRGGR